MLDKKNFYIKRKIIAIIVVMFLILYSIMGLFNYSQAATYNQYIKSGIDAFPPEYQTYLRKLQADHDDWTFDAYYTGIDWNTAIESEYGPHDDPKNRIKTTDNSKKCGCSFLKSGYYCASKETIKYYMDPRNFLTEVNIFQFSEMSFNPSVHTIESVKEIVKGTFLENNAQDIYDAAKESGISPFSIRAKIIQEVTKPGSGGKQGTDSISGKYPGYEGLYNYYNYGAHDTGNAIVNALEYAKKEGWNTPRKAIIEGAKKMGSSYVNAGQNTSYFYKFDVVGKSILKAGNSQTVDTSMLFSHQYMTNIEDPYSQSITLYNMYSKNNLLENKINFIIPVYNNMPGVTYKPSTVTGDVYWVDVQDALTLRSAPTTSASKVGSLKRGERVEMLQRNCAQANGYSWDKIKTSGGTICYAASQYLKKDGNSKQDSVKKDDKAKQIKAEPKVTVEKIKSTYGNNVTIKDKNGKNITSGNIGTNAKVTINGNTYTVIKMGDIDGDGEVLAKDALAILKHSTGAKRISDKNEVIAADINADGNPNAKDALQALKCSTGAEKINI